jgi:hypothetical protein
MPYLTKDDVVTMLKARQQKQIVDQHLIIGLPYVFQNDPALYTAMQNALAAQLRTPIADISIIGSARTGFSLDPDKFGASFSAASDIDTIIVNSSMFDVAWQQLYMTGRKRLATIPRVQTAFREHRTNNVFYGYIEPAKLPGIVTLAQHWFQTFMKLPNIKGLANREISGRLYRTWDHVRAHQLYSLECIAINLNL